MAKGETSWRLTAHCCRSCFGRMLVSAEGDAACCSNCGALAPSVAEQCACGVRLSNGADANLRCVRNTRRSPDWPGEIVVEETKRKAK